MTIRSLCLIGLLQLTLPCVSLKADDRANNDKLLNSALGTWRSGALLSTRHQLDALIEEGTGDPRPLYFRGMLKEQLREDGSDDFEAAAILEAETGTTSLVNQALEKTQGPLRGKIERFRIAARNALKADPAAAQLQLVYRDALEARRRGRPDLAIDLLEEATTTGTDPRYFYMLGVTLAETGEIEKAKSAFREGLIHETTPEDVELVSLALADVQGEIRRIIEEETVVETDDGTITRQTNVLDVQRRALMSQEQLLVGVSVANEQASEEAAALAAANRKAAADAILAENMARAELAARIAERPVVPPGDPSPVPEPVSVAEPVVAATEAMPVDPDAPVNPFLGRDTTVAPAAGLSVAPTSSITAGPIDMSYLPASTEYLTYVRPADLLASGFVRPLTELPQFQQTVSEMAAETGFAPADVDSVTMGMGNVMAAILPVIGQVASGARPDAPAISRQLMGGENAMIVIRTNKDIDLAPLMARIKGAESMHANETYYVLPNPDPAQPQMVLYPVDTRTFLMSSEPGIQAAISNGAGEATNDQFAFVSRASHFVQAFSSPLLAGMSGSIPPAPEQAPPQIAQFLDAIRGRIAGVAVVAEAGSDLSIHISLNLTEPSAAADANQALAGLTAMGKQMAPLFLGQAPPELQPALMQSVNSLSSAYAETVVTATIAVPGTLVDVLKDNPQLLGPVAAARQAAQSTRQLNNLRSIGLAMLNFHDTFNHFPSSDGNGQQGDAKKSGLSWRVHILPFLEQGELYSQFHLDEPWDSEHNRTLIPQMPEVYQVDGVTVPGQTTVHVFNSPGTPFDPAAPVSLSDLSDGSSNTILAVVAGPETASEWTKPGGLEFDPVAPLTALGTVNEMFQTVFCDGAVRNLAVNIDPQLLSLLIQHKDGTPLPSGSF